MRSFKSKSGKPIRGTTKPFLTEEYIKTRTIVLGRGESYNEFYKFRTICKHFTVDRWRNSTQFMNYYKTLPKMTIKGFLKQLGEKEELIHFFMCFIDYYNHANRCNYFVIDDECLKTVDQHAVAQSAFQDVKKLVKGDVAKVVQKLDKVTTMQPAELSAIRNQYRLLLESAAIFSNTFKIIFHGELPARISKEVFDMIFDLDNKIEKYYTADCIGYVVRTKKKKPIYKRVNFDAAFMLSLSETIHDVRRRRL